MVFHVVAVSLAAFPSVGTAGLNRSAWGQPTVQGEFRAWSGRLAALGIHLTPSELEDRLWTIANDSEAVREDVLTPFQPYYRYCGTWQSWKMFVAPHRHPAKLHVDIQRDGQWQPVYEARSDEHRWRADQLGHIRTRAVLFRYAWAGYGERYRALARWIARRAGEDFPQAERVRIRYYGYRTPTPQEARRGELPPGEFRQVADVALSRYR